MAPLRFGIIACSKVARRRFLPALLGSNVARLERIGSRDAARAELYAREFSCGKYGGYGAVLADPEVDIVYISTPPSLHLEWVLKAADAGKHIWCEKPAFPDYKSAVRAVDYCRAAGVRLIEGYVFKYHPQHARAKSIITEQRIGAPRFLYSEFTYPRPTEGDIRLKTDLAGGVYHDSAGYPVAAALLQLPGEPAEVFCQLGKDSATGVDDSFTMWLGFSGGETAQLLAGFGLLYRSTYSVLGTRGRLSLARAFSVAPNMKAVLQLETDGGDETIIVDPADQFLLMIDDVARKIRGDSAGSEKRAFETELLRQHAIMDAAGRSHRERRMVALSEYPI
jgi:predicted dehydrogenase